LDGALESGYKGEQVIAHCGIGTARLKLGNMSGATASERAARALVRAAPDSLTESTEALQLFSARLAAAAGEVEGALQILARLEDAVGGRDRYLAAVYRLERADIMHAHQHAHWMPLAASAAADFRFLGATPDALRA